MKPPPRVASPVDIAAVLARRVVGQGAAVREMATALAKNLAGLPAGNILLVGSSGTGKTTLMRAVEEYLAAEPDPARRSTVVRVHANVLAEEAESGRGGQAILLKLLARAREQLGGEPTLEAVLERAGRGTILVDEVDKIRGMVAGAPHVPGIRAQEALLTLIENERIPVRLPEGWGGGSMTLDASSLLFVAAGAFESLYEAVLDRVTVGRDRGALQDVTVVEGDELREERHFALRDWLTSEDLFDYGMTPQFLSRFESRILLDDLGEDDLLEILADGADSPLRRAQAYFESQGIRLAISPAAVRRIAAEAARQPRLGARALAEVFRRVIREHEFDPRAASREGALTLEVTEVEAALAPPPGGGRRR